jgi:MoaA/NifB/PqqE/SkfB family radical SAM enzyme
MAVVLKGDRRWPRLPLQGAFDLTYRCGNDCRHCWVRLSPNASQAPDELGFEDIRRIADEARALGCRRWSISGGEPMLRSDFAEVFDYLTARAAGYSLNTNGALITPAIAKLMVRKGRKMVALYGATAEVHDRITRTPGSFAATMRGFAYLQEAGAGFIVQLIPMRDNWHQWPDMVSLARSLGPHYRVGAAWLCLSASGSADKNQEIGRERLAPEDVVALDPPNCWVAGKGECSGTGCSTVRDDRLFANCILGRNEFHIDPSGGLAWCAFIKAPALRYDLRHGSFQEGWEKFMPALAEEVRGGGEYLASCGSCELRDDCRTCGAYAYLEHGRFEGKVEYLCDVARASRAFVRDWERNHRRYFSIAGITVQVDSDLPFEEHTLGDRFATFAVAGKGDDVVKIHHHFGLPDLDDRELGTRVYRDPPWEVFRKGARWTYVLVGAPSNERAVYQVAVLNDDHSRGHIYCPDDRAFRRGVLSSLTMFPTDQVLLARVLAHRQACYLHSSAVVVDGAGLLFVGHSEAGKSTTIKLLKGQAQILCDDRNIVRRWPEGFRVHGTWSHGEVPDVSGGSAPLAAILLLRKAAENRLVRIEDPKLVRNELLACVVKPVVDKDWWERTLVLVHRLAKEIPCYEMRFDRSGDIVPLLLDLARQIPRKEAALVAR